MTHYDVLVIGTGAGGGTLAHSLAFEGKRVLLLERGDFLPTERENWDPREVFLNGRYVSRDTWTDGKGKEFQPQAHYFVGGATKMYGAALYRLRPEDFGPLAHIDGISPAWPLSYADMEPWYSEAEWLYQVHGSHGEDPTEGPSSRQYRWPAVTHEPRIAQISDGLAAAGYHPFHAPCGVKLTESTLPVTAAGLCRKCATCDGFPCAVDAKCDAETIAVRPILAMPNVTLRTNTEVTRLVTDPTGRTVTGAVASTGEVFTADVVVVAAGAANTARLLLMSASDAHPNGLANESDQVGRNYMYHLSRAVLAIDREPNHTRFQKTLGLNDFYLAGDYSPWPLGNIQMVGKSSATAMRGESPLARLAPEWPLAKVAEHAVDFWLTTEDLPRHSNRVTVDANGRINLSYRPTNVGEGDALYGALRRVMGTIGIRSHRVIPQVWVSKGIPVAGVAHQAGTARMGTEPRTSVLDVNCKAHGLDNLYVADASVFPSIGAVNPALTVMANALRVAEHIITRLS